ncbi:MAG: hypothetical protein U0136_10530 [Bdellovibrionota bacterium]
MQLQSARRRSTSRETLRFLLLVSFTITVWCFQNYYASWNEQTQIGSQVNSSRLQPDDILQLRRLLSLPDSPEKLGPAEALSPAEEIMRRLQAERSTDERAVSTLTELVTRGRGQAIAFTIIAAYLMLLARRLMRPSFQTGIAAEREALFREKEQALTERSAALDAEVAEKAAPLEAELREKLAALEKSRQEHQGKVREHQTAASKLAGERTAFERERSNANSELDARERALQAREQQAATARQKAETALADAKRATVDLAALVTRLDAYTDLGAAAAHARDTLAGNPNLAGAVEQARLV